MTLVPQSEFPRQSQRAWKGAPRFDKECVTSPQKNDIEEKLYTTTFRVRQPLTGRSTTPNLLKVQMLTGIKFNQILATQRRLDREDQICGIIEAIKQDELLEPIKIAYEEDTDRYFLVDGHHRAAGFYLAGYDELPYGAFDLLFHRGVSWKRETWLFTEFLRKCGHERASRKSVDA